MHSALLRPSVLMLALAGVLAATQSHAAPPDVDTLSVASRAEFVEATRQAVLDNADTGLIITRVDPDLAPVIGRMAESPEWIAVEAELAGCLYDHHAAAGETRLLAKSIVSMYETTEIIRTNPDITLLTLMNGDVPPEFEAASLGEAEDEAVMDAYMACFGEGDLFARMMTPDMMLVVSSLMKTTLEAQGIPTEDLPPEFFSPQMFQQFFIAPDTAPN